MSDGRALTELQDAILQGQQVEIKDNENQLMKLRILIK